MDLNRLIHKIRDGCILVEAASVAMNPTDWKSIERRAVPGVTLGCDYASIVQNVGKTKKKRVQTRRSSPWVCP